MRTKSGPPVVHRRAIANWPPEPSARAEIEQSGNSEIAEGGAHRRVRTRLPKFRVGEREDALKEYITSQLVSMTRAHCPGSILRPPALYSHNALLLPTLPTMNDNLTASKADAGKLPSKQSVEQDDGWSRRPPVRLLRVDQANAPLPRQGSPSRLITARYVSPRTAAVRVPKPVLVRSTPPPPVSRRRQRLRGGHSRQRRGLHLDVSGDGRRYA